MMDMDSTDGRSSRPRCGQKISMDEAPTWKADGPLRAKARRERRELVVMVRRRQRCQAS